MSGGGPTTFWDDQFNANEVDASLFSRFPNYLDRGVTFFGSVRGKKVLDVGCGLGGYSIALARLGADVTAIDTSATAIAKIDRFAKQGRLQLTALVYDAMKIRDLEGFDFVVGSMILHHLEPFEDFCESLYAAIRPNGKAFFYENNAASRLLVWCRHHLAGRFGIPKYGDDTEFPLSPKELNTLRSRFAVSVDYPEMLFFGMAADYLFHRKGAALLNKIDQFLFRHNILTSYSYRQIIFLEKQCGLPLAGC